MRGIHAENPFWFLINIDQHIKKSLPVVPACGQSIGVSAGIHKVAFLNVCENSLDVGIFHLAGIIQQDLND